MFNIILQYLPVLGISIVVNILLGMYYNIGISNQEFNIKTFIQGIIKAGVIAISFIGLAYCFDATGAVIDIASFELNPELIMISAITLYLAKGCITLANILKVTKSNSKEESK